jgi:hypothetical protein
VVAPARKPDNEIALMQTPGGFGTPPFEHQGRELQVRVDGAELFGDGPPEDETPLEIDPVAAAGLGKFYAFAHGALETLRATRSTADELRGPGRVSWPRAIRCTHRRRRLPGAQRGVAGDRAQRRELSLG